MLQNMPFKLVGGDRRAVDALLADTGCEALFSDV